MPQFNLPRKKVTMVQMWASVLLIALALIFSLAPMINLKSVDNAAEITEMAQGIGLSLFEIPEDVDVSAVKLVSSVSLIVNIFTSSIPGEEGYTEDQVAKQQELKEYMETEEGKADIATALCIAATIMNALDFESMSSGDSNIIGTVLSIFVTFIALFATLILLVVIPVVIAFQLIVAVINAAKHIANPEDAAAAVSNKLPGMISVVLLFMLAQCVIPGMSQAWGVTALCSVIIVSIVLNFVASRLREYPAKQFMYLNVLQGGALLGIVGFLVFFFNLIKTGIFNAFVKGSFFGALLGNAAGAIASEGEQAMDTGLMVTGILMIVYLAVVLGCAGYLDKAARRLCCTVKRERPRGLIGKLFTPKAKDNNIVMAACTLAAFIIPTYVATVEVEGLLGAKVSVLELNGDQQAALNAALIGIIIMIVAEVAVIVLKKVLCKDLTEHEAEELMMGVAMSSDEILAEAKKVVAEAEAAAAAAKAAEEVEAVAEAPVEDTAPAEEAPAEEALAEEAVAEEAKAE